MEIKKILENISNFLIKRFIELFGLLVSILSILLLISLLSYYPEDPNFIFPDNTEIRNILGFRGSFISDLFFQSIGLISVLISITFFTTGINIIRTKKVLFILQNSFYLILYSILGSLFFAIYYPESFWLTINGNGGFIGKLLNETFLTSLVNLNKQIAYYFLIISISALFLISINLNISWFFSLIKKLTNKLFSKKNKTKNYNEEVANKVENL
nr:DNA translocase FtsK 4TM domain-containing protein [Pelagibacterales bacterium]